MWQILKQILHVGLPTESAPEANDAWRTDGEKIQSEILHILGRALCIRHIDAGSCNACELEINAVGNPYYNIEGLGIKFVASPRHADMLLVTGPVTKNMEAAVMYAYDATPDPKLVVALGDCACTGGIFGENYATCGRVSNILPVDVTIPGCPPKPIDILRGILTAVSPSSSKSEPAPQNWAVG